MRLVNRYLLREVTGYSLLGLSVFLFILLTPELLRLSELLARENIAVSQLLVLLLSVLPEKLLWAIPLGLLAGLLLGLSRMAADAEVVALKATGVNPARLLRPILAFAGLGTALTLATAAWWWPAAAQTIRRMQTELGPGQVSYEVTPRVFDERFPNVVLYVHDVEEGGASWRGVLLADVSLPDQTRLTLAETGVVLPDPVRGVLRLHLTGGSSHVYSAAEPNRYSVSTFADNVMTLALPESSQSLRIRNHADLSLTKLWEVSRQSSDWRSARADFHRRLALPAACLVFGLVSLPLGLLAERSGRAVGFVAAIGVALAYYFLFLFGDRLAREGSLPPALGVWLANLIVAIPAPLYFYRQRRSVGGGVLNGLAASVAGLGALSGRRRPTVSTSGSSAASNSRSGWRIPYTLDLYLLREVLFYALLLTAALLLLFGLFSLLELVDDITAHDTPWPVVARFLWFLMPQAFYLMVPLGLLLGILVTIALMSTRNELVAIKGAGISLYRLALPVVGLGLAFSALLFLMDQHYLPQANQQQEALRNQIKGRPPQTFFRTERRWIFGEQPRIYHYSFFDPRENLLARLNVLELSVGSFKLQRRIFATRAHWEPHLETWVLEQGWERLFADGRAVEFRRFDVASFRELSERPAYFRKEVRESQQMNWRELGRYVADLRQSGFEVTQLEVQWHRKFAFPLVAAVITLLAFPFGASMGRRGAIGGLAVGIGLGFLFWVLSGFFEALGNLALLPAVLAGWGPDAIFLFGGLYRFLQIDT